MRIQSKRVYLCGRFVPAQLVIEDEKIKAVNAWGKDIADVDHGEDRILPGMIDIHGHGGFGFDTNDADMEGLQRWCRGLPQEGITAFLPTAVTDAKARMCAALQVVAEAMTQHVKGAQILGIHMEGPFIEPKKRGAQPLAHIQAPSIALFKELQEAAKGNIRMITMACERDEDFALTRYCAEEGVIVSIGHSMISYEDALLAIANGASSITHVYNGMDSLHHRTPGLVGVGMAFEGEVYGEINCDGNHVHWAPLRAMVRTFGKHHVIMMDDAMCAKNCKPGHYHFGGNDIEVKPNGSAYIAGSDVLAGGTMRFVDGVYNLIEHVGLPWDWVVAMTSQNPARLLGIDKKKGKIQVGYDADLYVLGKDYQIRQTYCLGAAQL